MKRLRKRFSLRPTQSNQSGWTLAELLIVVIIIAILAVIFLLINWKRNVFRAQDIRRKTDVANIRRAFEEYYNDTNCYPSLTVLNACGSGDFRPYLTKIPCDPVTREPYKYEPDSAANLCAGNRICAKLQDLADPDITALGCDPVTGCGWGMYWNYCLAAGTTVSASGFVSSSTPTPTPDQGDLYPGPFACSNAGICNDMGSPKALGCPRSWADAACGGLCPGNPQYWCP